LSQRGKNEGKEDKNMDVNGIKERFLSQSGYYFKKEEIPEIGSKEVDFILKEQVNRKLDNINYNVNIIKNCILAFVGISAVSLIVSIVSLIKVMNLFR